MLHTKFPGNRSTGSANEDFEGLLLYTGVADIQHLCFSYISYANVRTCTLHQFLLV